MRGWCTAAEGWRGPGVWNNWKGQLLGELYDAAQERLRLGHLRHGREHRMARKQAEVREALGERAALVDRFAPLFDDAYWIAEPVDIIALNLRHHEAALARQSTLMFHPYLFGSPHGPHASGAFLGLHGWHDRGPMLRAVVVTRR